MKDLLDKEITAQVDFRVINEFRELLVSGNVCDVETLIVTGDGRSLPVRITGFNLQLLTSDDPYTILKIKNVDLDKSSKSIWQRISEFEDFTYRASHDLRGPIATILGIVNLMRMRKDDSEVDYFFDLIHAHAEKLNQNLKDLIRN